MVLVRWWWRGVKFCWLWEWEWAGGEKGRLGEGEDLLNSGDDGRESLGDLFMWGSGFGSCVGFGTWEE